MKINTLPKLLILPLLLLPIFWHSSLSLTTNSRWIVSPSGERFKLRCVNWAGHLNAMIPEGLHEQPLTHIAQMIPSMGFNCARLTWAVKMYTQFANITVEQSLNNLSLIGAKDGIMKNNPNFLGMSISDVQKAVISELEANNVVVILDNHVSKPMWCCDWNDGNGFFGDKYFDPREWLLGLSIVANKYKDTSNVVGMSLRNELRGPGQTWGAWFNFMQLGAEEIHKQNPNFLVIVSGLDYDSKLGILRQQPFKVSFQNQLVFEAHWYPFGNSVENWKTHTNTYCGSLTNQFLENSGFLLSGSGSSPSFPLFLSEFGLDLRGGDDMQNLYITCLLVYLAGSDMDWALWALQGNYMFREGQQNMEEFYGVLSSDWGSVRSTSMLQRLQLIQQQFYDASKQNPVYFIMYHPQTGSCIHVENGNKIYNTDCKSWAHWGYQNDNKIIRIKDSGGKCLAATGDGLPVTLSGDCSSNQSMWKMISGSNLHFATTDKSGKLLCLDWDTKSSTIITNKCLCLDDEGNDVEPCAENPQKQWFKLVLANVIS